MNNNKIKIIVFTLLSVASLTILFFLLFEKKEVEIHTQAANEVRRNPFIAAERYLTKTGIEAESVNKKELLVNLPSTDDLIFINKLGGNLPAQREDTLIEWINKGGCLVITHDKFWNDDSEKSGNTLLDKLDIRLLPTYEEVDNAETDENDNEDKPGNNKKPDINNPWSFEEEKVLITFPDSGTGEIEMDTARILTKDDAVNATVFTGDVGAHIIIRDIGYGRVIILSDNFFLQNTKIGNNDHAWFLSQISKNRKKVWILYNSIMPSFLSILISNAQYFIVSLILLLVFSILRLNMNIGPINKIQDTSSRNIIENIQASGNFIVRHRKKAMLIYQTRAAIEKNIAKKHLFFETKDPQQKYELIAKWTNIPVEHIQMAFQTEADSTEAFIRITGLLKQIHFDLLVNNKKTEKT